MQEISMIILSHLLDSFFLNWTYSFTVISPLWIFLICFLALFSVTFALFAIEFGFLSSNVLLQIRNFFKKNLLVLAWPTVGRRGYTKQYDTICHLVRAGLTEMIISMHYISVWAIDFMHLSMRLIWVLLIDYGVFLNELDIVRYLICGEGCHARF